MDITVLNVGVNVWRDNCVISPSVWSYESAGPQNRPPEHRRTLGGYPCIAAVDVFAARSPRRQKERGAFCFGLVPVRGAEAGAAPSPLFSAENW